MRIITTILIALALYSVIGTGENVSEIKRVAPAEVAARNWKILRYEGHQWGSWAKHGEYCWYHVCNADNPNIQYRVRVSLWNGELQFWYNEPEKLQRLNVNYENQKPN